MLEMKKKAIGSIREMLEGRMSARLKPKDEAPPHGEIEEVAELGEGEMPMDEVKERGAGKDELTEKIAAKGGDLSSLSPEEQAQLQSLYEKMGC